jgi:hypothetical protein
VAFFGDLANSLGLVGGLVFDSRLKDIARIVPLIVLLPVAFFRRGLLLPRLGIVA